MAPLVLLVAALTAAPPMLAIGPGSYAPIDQADDVPARAVAKFLLDATLVSNADFLAFVTEHPAWRRDRVRKLFAEPTYLSQWRSALDTGALEKRAPVVEVSWFAAAAYCRAQGKRLPSEAEWELAAAASAVAKDARSDPASLDAFVAEQLAWYGARPDRLPPVGQSVPNAWGVHDMHTLVWEWVADFTSSLSPSDARGGSDAAFCGSAPGSSADAAAYAAFMRRALRSSLEGAFALSTLGFRCAKDIAPRTTP